MYCIIRIWYIKSFWLVEDHIVVSTAWSNESTVLYRALMFNRLSIHSTLFFFLLFWCFGKRKNVHLKFISFCHASSCNFINAIYQIYIFSFFTKHLFQLVFQESNFSWAIRTKCTCGMMLMILSSFKTCWKVYKRLFLLVHRLSRLMHMLGC